MSRSSSFDCGLRPKTTWQTYEHTHTHTLHQINSCQSHAILSHYFHFHFPQRTIVTALLQFSQVDQFRYSFLLQIYA